MPAPRVYNMEEYTQTISLWQTTKLTAKQIAKVVNIPVHIVYRIKYEYPLFCRRNDDTDHS